ncbi:MAG: radical SAM protein, partial [Deltaproteobacteria bacterium]|nr:radical SAM protein [Deltaproteobacteria bacterium]
MKRVSVKTIGCKTNFADTRVLETSLEKLGFAVVPYGEVSDLVIVNSCVVTQRAEADSRRALTKGKRSGGNPKTVLTGCGVLKNGKPSLAEFADLVLPMEHQGSEKKLTALFAGQIARKDLKGYGRESLSRANRSRVFVKIQNGCDNRCSYCIVPSVRGKSVSRHHEDVLKEIRAYEDQGFPEVVLTGNHIGSYGNDIPGLPSLSTLVEMALKGTGRIRIRLSSTEVDEVDPHLLEMVTGEKRLCNHLHIPLQ